MAHVEHRVNGNLHRKDGPAIIFADGSVEWWLDGMRHREDGPAYVAASGTKAYYIAGYELTEVEFLALGKLKKAFTSQAT
jgi:hypothetical protein